MELEQEPVTRPDTSEMRPASAAGISFLRPPRHHGRMFGWSGSTAIGKEYSEFLRELLLTITSLLIFVAATFGAYLASEYDRRISAVMIYLVGVTLVGASSGLKAGLIAGVTASAIYNFFLSEPLFHFSASSADDFIPLIAFNVTAILSGTLAGRLNDRAKAAEQAQAQVDRLLQISSRLQQAVRLEDVAEAIQEIFGSPDDVELFAATGGRLIGIGRAGRNCRLANQILSEGVHRREAEGCVGYLLTTANRPAGVIVFRSDVTWPSKTERIDVAAFINLLSIAVERCQLLNQLSETEAVRRSEELKTALLSSLSHDLRTPLAAISASATSLASFGGDLSEAVRIEMLQTIQDQCARLNRYTTNLLNLGQLQAGIRAEQMEDVDAIELLGAAIGAARGSGTPHIITKLLSCSAATILANPVMIEQMFHNVIENAIQYSETGSEIMITGGIADNFVEIAVTDRGCGIPASELDRVFDRFYRSSQSARKEGHGLGLSIARGFAEAFGGTIRAESPHALGQGTQITIRLPLAEKVPEEATS